jgi:hypothetical protein
VEWEDEVGKGSGKGMQMWKRKIVLESGKENLNWELGDRRGKGNEIRKFKIKSIIIFSEFDETNRIAHKMHTKSSKKFH